MWNMFGVTDKVVSVEHFVDASRRLRFFSDFPHLATAIRNFFTEHSKYDMIWVSTYILRNLIRRQKYLSIPIINQTPDRPVALKHWFAILDLEDPSSYAVKVNFQLRKEHIQPQYYQKINVAVAFQVN